MQQLSSYAEVLGVRILTNKFAGTTIQLILLSNLNQLKYILGSPNRKLRSLGTEVNIYRKTLPPDPAIPLGPRCFKTESAAKEQTT